MVLARSEGADSLVGRRLFTTPGSGSTPVARSRRAESTASTRFTGFTGARTAPWMVNVGMSESALRKQLASSLREDLLLLLLALALAVLMATLVGQRITQPIAALVDAARAFERGETATRGTVVGPREVRLLGSAFNQMADTVRAPHRRPRRQ